MADLDVNKIGPDGKLISGQDKKVPKEPEPIELFPNEKTSMASTSCSDETIWSSTPKAIDNGPQIFISPEQHAKVAAEHEADMAAAKASAETQKAVEEAKAKDLLTKCNRENDATQSEIKDLTPAEKIEFAKLAVAAKDTVPDMDFAGKNLDAKLKETYPDATPEQLAEIKVKGNIENMTPQTTRLSSVVQTKDGTVYSSDLYEKGKLVKYDQYKARVEYSVSVNEGDNVSKILKNIYGSAEPDLIKILTERNSLKNANKIKPGQILFIPGKAKTSKGVYYANGGKADNIENTEDFKSIVYGDIQQARMNKCMDESSTPPEIEIVQSTPAPAASTTAATEEVASTNISSAPDIKLEPTPTQLAQKAADDAAKKPEEEPSNIQVNF